MSKMESARKIADRMIKHHRDTGENPFIDEEGGGLSEDFCLFCIAVAREFEFPPHDMSEFIFQLIDADFKLVGE